VAQDVDGTIIAAKLEIAMVRGKPTVQDLRHFDPPFLEIKAARSLLASIAGITIDPDFEGVLLHPVPRA